MQVQENSKKSIVRECCHGLVEEGGRGLRILMRFWTDSLDIQPLRALKVVLDYIGYLMTASIF